MEADHPGGTVPAETESYRRELQEALFNEAGAGLLAISPAGVVLVANRFAREGLGCYAGVPLRELIPELWVHVAETLRDRRRRVEIPVQAGGISFLTRINAGPG